MPPAQVTNLTVTEVTSDYINLGWDQNTEGDFDHYNIYKSINRNFVVTPNTKPIQHTSHNNYSDHEIVGSITYYYQVGAVDRSGSMGPLSNQVGKRTPMEPFLIWTMITCFSLLIVIGALSALWPINFQDFSLTFNGDPVFKDAGIASIIDNSNSTKFITIYGLKNTTGAKMSPSDMTSKIGPVIESQDVNVTGLSNFSSPNMTDGLKYSFRIHSDHQSPGSYRGLLVISGKINPAIPISVETPPDLIRALGWVVVGVLVAIVIWEVVKYIKKNNDETQKYSLIDESGRELENAEYNWRKSLYYASKAQDSTVDLSIFEDHIQDQAVLNTNRDNIINEIILNQQLAERFGRKEAIARISAESTTQSASIKAAHVQEYRIRLSRPLSLAARIALVELASAGIGIVVALIALLNNDYLAGLRVIDTHAAVVLVGLGIGIGSLKEIVDK